jgi:hypothetical protein
MQAWSVAAGKICSIFPLSKQSKSVEYFGRLNMETVENFIFHRNTSRRMCPRTFPILSNDLTALPLFYCITDAVDCWVSILSIIGHIYPSVGPNSAQKHGSYLHQMERPRKSARMAEWRTETTLQESGSAALPHFLTGVETETEIYCNILR